MNNTWTLSLGMLVILSLFAKAQTANTGEMVIMPDTQVGVVNDFTNTQNGSFLNDGELFIYANFNNDGSVDFLDEGLTRFEGSSIQQITGSQESYFYNTRFNNTSIDVPFQLLGAISVSNQSNFDEGIVDNDNFGGTFSFEQFADHINTSDFSHVDGPVLKNGDTGFEFPIGDGGFFRDATISAPEAEVDQYSGHYFLENSDTPQTPHALSAGVIVQIDNTEYWEVLRTEGTSEVLLTLGRDAVTSPNFIMNADLGAIHIVRWDETLGFWISEGGVPDAANDTVTSIVEVTGYGIFTLALVEEALLLPDDLVIYNAVSPDNSDGKNDFFFIDGIDRYPNNTVKIFNRWGVEVFSTRSYDEGSNVFRGFSDGRLTVERSERLPTGTYYYILEYEFPGANGIPAQMVKKAGYLYLTTD